MLTIGQYIKSILKRRGLTVRNLAEMMTEEERKHGSQTTVAYTHIITEINQDTITIDRARKMEVALGLPMFQLVYLINPYLTKAQKERLEDIYKTKSKEGLKNEQL